MLCLSGVPMIWAAAAGDIVAADDSNVPAPVEVATNLAEPQFQDGVSKTGSLGGIGKDAGAIVEEKLVGTNVVGYEEVEITIGVDIGKGSAETPVAISNASLF